MKLTELPRGVLELLCAHELFRRLGFEPEQLRPFMAKDARRGGAETLYLELQTEPKFVFGVSPRFCSHDELSAWWRLGTALWNTEAPQAEVDAIWNASLCKPMMQAVGVALFEKGITAPAIAALLAERERG